MNHIHVTFRRLRAEAGDINVLLIPLILVVVLFFAAAGFGGWAYMQMLDYKDNSDKKVAAAVTAARQDEDEIKDKAFAETEKQPLKTYTGPDQFGAVKVTYPKTWSAYVSSGTTATQPLEAYFHPNFVMSINDQDAAFALRVSVVTQSYNALVTANASAVKNGQITAAPFSFAKVPNVVGIRYDGSIVPGKKITGSTILMPLRDKTLKVSTESPLFVTDFNNNILPSLSFSP